MLNFRFRCDVLLVSGLAVCIQAAPTMAQEIPTLPSHFVNAPRPPTPPQGEAGQAEQDPGDSGQLEPDQGDTARDSGCAGLLSQLAQARSELSTARNGLHKSTTALQQFELRYAQLQRDMPTFRDEVEAATELSQTEKTNLSMATRIAASAKANMDAQQQRVNAAQSLYNRRQGAHSETVRLQSSPDPDISSAAITLTQKLAEDMNIAESDLASARKALQDAKGDFGAKQLARNAVERAYRDAKAAKDGLQQLVQQRQHDLDELQLQVAKAKAARTAAQSRFDASVQALMSLVEALDACSRQATHDKHQTENPARKEPQNKGRHVAAPPRRQDPDDDCRFCSDWWDQHLLANDCRHHQFGEQLNSLTTAPESAAGLILRDTFSTIADPTLIETQSKTAGRIDPSGSGQQASEDSDPKKFGYVVFREPAQFPVRGFDRHGDRSVDRDPAVIYEGMAIEIEPDGHYTVKFTMEAPATEATVRLQLHVWQTKPADSNDPNNHDRVFEEIGTVTLPPLRYQPGRDEVTDGHALVWKAKQTGYSPLLMCLARSHYGNYRITRSGTAEFGSVPMRTASY